MSNNKRRDIIKGGIALAAVSGLPVQLFAQDPQVVEQIVYVCPMHPDVNSKLPGNCHKCNMKLVATNANTAGSTEFFMCPMHPDVIRTEPGTCPKCNMKLIKSNPPETEDFIVKIETTPPVPRAGEKITLRFKVLNPKDEKQVKEFNILHDMPFHLFIISQDFEHFDHIHPEKLPDGTFTIDTFLPKEGYYKVFCDLFPVGGMPQVIHHNLVTAGFKGDLVSSVARLTPDKELTKVVEGTRFELKFDPEDPYSGKHAELHYHLVDAKTDEPVKDLQPYLGAWGHTLILSEDATDYLHSHPTEMLPEDIDRSKLVGKPDVVFDTFFPRPGNYRIWSQFQRGEKLITVSFTVHVPRLS